MFVVKESRYVIDTNSVKIYLEKKKNNEFDLVTERLSTSKPA